MLSQSQVETVIMTWINSLSLGCDAIWLDQNFARPNLPYIGLRLTPGSVVHQDYEARTDSNGDAEVLGDRKISLVVETYGSAGYDLIHKIDNSLEKLSVNIDLHANGLSFLQHGSIIDVSQLLDKEIEKRFRTEMLFLYRYIDTDSVGFIDTVEIDKTVLDVDLQTITIDTVTITIP